MARVTIAQLAISASLIKYQHSSDIGKVSFCMLITVVL